MRINNYYASNNSNVLGANSKASKGNNRNYSNDNAQLLSNLNPSLENTPIKMIMDNEKVKSSYFAARIQTVDEEEIDSSNTMLNKWFGKFPPDLVETCQEAIGKRIPIGSSNEDLYKIYETVSIYLSNSIEQYKKDNNITELSKKDYTKILQLCKETVNMELKNKGLTKEDYNNLCYYEELFDLATELFRKN